LFVEINISSAQRRIADDRSLVSGGAVVSRAQTLDSFNPNAGLTVLAAIVQPDGKM
jgi:hypothetical protein